MQTPGPDHPITATPTRRRYRARFQNHVIADSTSAVVLQEADLPAVIYFPRENVETGFFSKSDYVTHCPYKGDATHWSMIMNGDITENVAWSYEDPYPAVAEIVGRIAFYPSKVEVYEVTEEELETRHRDDAVATWPAPNNPA